MPQTAQAGDGAVLQGSWTRTSAGGGPGEGGAPEGPPGGPVPPLPLGRRLPAPLLGLRPGLAHLQALGGRFGGESCCVQDDGEVKSKGGESVRDMSVQEKEEEGAGQR